MKEFEYLAREALLQPEPSIDGGFARDAKIAQLMKMQHEADRAEAAALLASRTRLVGGRVVGPWGPLLEPWVRQEDFGMLPDFLSVHLVESGSVVRLRDFQLLPAVVPGARAGEPLGMFLRYAVTMGGKQIASTGPLLDCRVGAQSLLLWFGDGGFTSPHAEFKPMPAAPVLRPPIKARDRVLWCKGLSWGPTADRLRHLADTTAMVSIAMIANRPEIEWRGIPDDQEVELTSEQCPGQLGALEWVWGKAKFVGGQPHVTYRLCVSNPGTGELREAYLRPACELVAKLLLGELG